MLHETDALSYLLTVLYIKGIIIFFITVPASRAEFLNFILMRKIKRYRMAGANPYSVYEVFTMNEIINRVAYQYRPWEVHRFEKISVIHFLN